MVVVVAGYVCVCALLRKVLLVSTLVDSTRAQWAASWLIDRRAIRRKDSNGRRRVLAAGCYVIIVLRRGGAGLSVEKADERRRGCARASVAVDANCQLPSKLRGRRQKGCRRAQKISGGATRVVENVLRAHWGWGTMCR